MKNEMMNERNGELKNGMKNEMMNERNGELRNGLKNERNGEMLFVGFVPQALQALQ